MVPDLKPSNPKDVIGSGKLPLELVPDTGVMYAALSFLEGALKYGRFNWRVAGVRNSIYVAAMRRHLAKYWNGEDVDLKTGVPHLSSVLACAMIILDAQVCGKLTDDRPPRVNLDKLMTAMQEDVVRLKGMFAEHHPHQYTIADTQCAESTIDELIHEFIKEGCPRPTDLQKGS